MAGAAVQLGGATQRLLPEGVPVRFFGTAVVSHILAWLAIALNAEEFPRFIGGIGPGLAAVHMLTIGVLTMTAMGASLQMLPVALGEAAPSSRLCNVIFVAVLIGGSGVIIGMATRETRLLLIGASVLALGVVTYVGTIACLLARASTPTGLIHHVWAGIVALTLAVGLAIALTINYDHPFIADLQAWALVHAVVAGFGFMGMFALGFGTVLIPLFAMAEAPAGSWLWASFGLLIVAIAVAVVGILLETRWLIAGGVTVGLAGTGLHLWLMTRALAGRMRRRLSPEFWLIRVSWSLLPVTLVLGLALAVGVAPDGTGALFGFVLLFGWLLTLLVGVLQRVMPFLASMHLLRKGKRSVAPSKLVPDGPATVHRWCHFSALALVAAGLALSWLPLIQFGAAIGGVGAVAFACFAAIVLLRTRTYLASSVVPKETRVS
jgi:hypothetical protein